MQKNLQSSGNIKFNGSTTKVPSNICTSNECSNEYLCRTEACKKRLQILLIEKLEQYLNLAPPSSQHSTSDTTELQRNFPQEQRNLNILEKEQDMLNKVNLLLRSLFDDIYNEIQYMKYDIIKLFNFNVKK